MFKVKSFTSIKDPDPSVPISEIFPIAKRTMVLLLRNHHKQIVETNFLNVYGAVDMIGGLEYHHANFMVLVEKLSEISIMSDDKDSERLILLQNLRHEAVAYLNRIGQYYHFANSRFVKQHISNSIEFIPTIIKLKFFRDKHASHRSIDDPRNEDDPHAQMIQAWGLSSVSALQYSAKDPSKALRTMGDMFDSKKLWLDAYVCFQMRGRGKNEFIDFSVEREHPKVLIEAFSLIETLIT
jgi:hypothetical protein